MKTDWNSLPSLSLSLSRPFLPCLPAWLVPHGGVNEHKCQHTDPNEYWQVRKKIIPLQEKLKWGPPRRRDVFPRSSSIRAGWIWGCWGMVPCSYQDRFEGTRGCILIIYLSFTTSHNSNSSGFVGTWWGFHVPVISFQISDGK